MHLQVELDCFIAGHAAVTAGSAIGLACFLIWTVDRAIITVDRGGLGHCSVFAVPIRQSAFILLVIATFTAEWLVRFDWFTECAEFSISVKLIAFTTVATFIADTAFESSWWSPSMIFSLLKLKALVFEKSLAIPLLALPFLFPRLPELYRILMADWKRTGGLQDIWYILVRLLSVRSLARRETLLPYRWEP